MDRIAEAWRWLRTQVRDYGVELRLGLRVSIAAVLAFVLSHWLNLPLALWTVLTAVILTQLNVGRSVKATLDYMVGTLGGVLYSGGIAILIPHNGEVALLAVLAIGIAPLAMLAAINPRFAAAPFTAVLVLLAPTLAPISPLQSALYRIIEVTLGAATGLAVSLLVLPSRAQELALEAAARMLHLMARLLPTLIEGLVEKLDGSHVRQLQESVGAALARLGAIATEAERERMTSLAAAPDPGPLLRTLLRLRHDLVMIGRAAWDPLPETLRAVLAPPLARISEAAVDYLHQSAAALTARSDPPALQPFEGALASYLAEIAEIRRAGLTHNQPVETVEHLFALGFALEQLHANFRDLARVAKAYARPSKAAGRRFASRWFR